MFEQAKEFYRSELKAIEESGLTKRERLIECAQNTSVQVQQKTVLNLCANNYLGLCDHPEIVQAAQAGMKQWGYGLSSVRFISGTQTIHHTLEQELSSFLGMEGTILYSSCFDANGGLFETLLGPEDAVISDALNHASIIDGIRLSKAKRYRYGNSDMKDLEQKLIEAKDCRIKLIATDGVFSMDGSIAKLAEICDLAEQYGAMVMVDDSHAVGFLGEAGRGSHEYCRVMGKVDILSGTLGKALGGASGGYISARQEIVDLLRQRSRPYLFSNSVSPAVVCASLKALELIQRNDDLLTKLKRNTVKFRTGMINLGFDIKEGTHPIVPIMLGDAVLASRMAEELLKRGVYVVGFFYPVVPKGQARIRVQISAAHSDEDIEFALSQFAAVKALDLGSD